MGISCPNSFAYDCEGLLGRLHWCRFVGFASHLIFLIALFCEGLLLLIPPPLYLYWNMAVLHLEFLSNMIQIFIFSLWEEKKSFLDTEFSPSISVISCFVLSLIEAILGFHDEEIWPFHFLWCLIDLCCFLILNYFFLSFLCEYRPP